MPSSPPRPPRPATPPRPPQHVVQPSLPAYAELHCRSNFSFLTGASHPGEPVSYTHLTLPTTERV